MRKASAQLVVETDLTAEKLVHFTAAGRVKEDDPFALAQPRPQIYLHIKTATPGGVTFIHGRCDVGFQPFYLNVFVNGDRRHGQDHSSAQRGCDQFNGTKLGAGLIHFGPLVHDERSLASPDLRALIAQVSDVYQVDVH